MEEAIMKIRDLCIGLLEEVSHNKPQESRGHYTGGIAFERNKRAQPVKEGTRCYTIGNLAEGPTQIMAPNKGAKVVTSNDESLEMRRDLLLVRILFLMEQVNS